MRYSILALIGVVVCGAALTAQQLPGQQAAPPALVQQPVQAQPSLDEILANWERGMTSIHSLIAHCTRTVIDKTWGKTEVFDGQAKYLKPSYASLEMRHAKEAARFEKFIINGQEVYTYAPDSKEIRIHRLPPPKSGQVAEDNVLSLVFGMKAVDAKKRYRLSLAPPPPNDTYYYYIDIIPVSAQDRSDFTRARLVLTRNNYLPRQLWFLHPNGNEVTWDLTKLTTAVPLQAAEFRRPTPPPGWQVRADAPGGTPQQPAARVIRQQQ